MKNSAILILSCPDKKGIVAAVADFLYKHNANILHADEHIDYESNLFFLRTEWDLQGFVLSKEEFTNQFSSIAEEFVMDFSLYYSDMRHRIAIFVSRDDHCLADLLLRHHSGELDCDIAYVLGNHNVTRPLADFYNIPFHYINSTEQSKHQLERQILSLVQEKKVDTIILARYMQILSGQFIEAFNNPIINIHHSFLPAFIGAKPYHQAYNRGVKIIGATAHYVTTQLDQGPIIEQDTYRISHRDRVVDLVQKGKDIEKIVLSRAVKWHVQNKVLRFGNKTVVFD